MKGGEPMTDETQQVERDADAMLVRDRAEWVGPLSFVVVVLVSGMLLVWLAVLQSADPPPSPLITEIKRLQTENAELRKQIDVLKGDRK